MSVKPPMQYGTRHQAEVKNTATAHRFQSSQPVQVLEEPMIRVPLRTVERYQAPAAGSAGGGGAAVGTLDADALKSIVDAIGNLDWVRWIKDRMAQAMAEETLGGGEVATEDPEPVRPERAEPERMKSSKRSASGAIEYRPGKAEGAQERFERRQAEHYRRCEEFDAVESGRKRIADQALAYAERTGCSYEDGLRAVGSSLPTEILPSRPV